MTPEQHQAAITAVNSAGLDEEVLTIVVSAINDAFASGSEVTDDDAVNAMEPGMAATYRAAETTAEEKAALLNVGRFNARATQIAIAMALANANKGKAAKPAADAPLTLAGLESVLPKVLLRLLPQSGRVAAPAASPSAPGALAAPAAFSAKIKGIEQAANVKRAKAILIAKAADEKGFNDWCAANRPD